MKKTIKTFVLISGFVLASGNVSAITLYYNQSSPTLNTWDTSSIGLTESGWLTDSWSSGSATTETEFMWTLSNLSAIYILTEWNTGTDDTNVDNVSFGTAASSTFDTGIDGWFVSGPNPASDAADQTLSTKPLSWDSSFGNSGGSVRVADEYPWTWIGAPDSYLGDQLAQYGNNFDMDLFIRYTDGVTYPALALVAPDVPAGWVPLPHKAFLSQPLLFSWV